MTRQCAHLCWCSPMQAAHDLLTCCSLMRLSCMSHALSWLLPSPERTLRAILTVIRQQLQIMQARDVWSPTPVSAIYRPHSTHCPCSHRGSCYIIMHACRLSTVGGVMHLASPKMLFSFTHWSWHTSLNLACMQLMCKFNFAAISRTIN